MTLPSTLGMPKYQKQADSKRRVKPNPNIVYTFTIQQLEHILGAQAHINITIIIIIRIISALKFIYTPVHSIQIQQNKQTNNTKAFPSSSSSLPLHHHYHQPFVIYKHTKIITLHVKCKVATKSILQKTTKTIYFEITQACK